MTTPSPQDVFPVMNELADFAREIISQNIGESSTTKLDGTPITASDARINDAVITGLHTHFPECTVLGEEGSREGPSSGVFLLDPIDGTAPYAAGICVAAFSLTYAIDGVSAAAVIDDPFTNTRFCAIRGEGATINGTSMALGAEPRSNIVNLSALAPRPSIATPGDSGHVPDFEARLFGSLRNSGFNPARFLSFAGPACRVASGALSGAFFGYPSHWDTLGVSLIASEAGAVVTTLSGGAFSGTDLTEGIIIAHPARYQELLRAVRISR